MLHFKILTKLLFASFSCFTLINCSQRNHLAPVVGAWYEKQDSKIHTVEKGETLYAIAWRYDSDYRQLAKWNGLSLPYAVQIGQKIHLKSKDTAESTPALTELHIGPLDAMRRGRDNPIRSNQEIKIYKKEAIREINSKKMLSKLERRLYKFNNDWFWPAKGKIINKFSPKLGNKGINIGGKIGDPIYAVEGGEVVYSGNGLRGYGNLLIIKHDTEHLSAYAHNRLLLVKEGDWVLKGQRVALMGQVARVRAMLHFEIRRAGKAVDPLLYLSKR